MKRPKDPPPPQTYHPKTPQKGGRFHKPTNIMRERVKTLAASGFLDDDAISRALRITRDTLVKYYSEELKIDGERKVAPKDNTRRHQQDELTRRQVAMHVAAGTPLTKVAEILGISITTLHRNYQDVIDSALEVANEKVAKSLYKMATGTARNKLGEKMAPNVIAAIFWLKARAGWRDVDTPEAPDFDPNLLEPTERRMLRMLLLKAQVNQGSVPTRAVLVDRNSPAPVQSAQATDEGGE